MSPFGVNMTPSVHRRLLFSFLVGLVLSSCATYYPPREYEFSKYEIIAQPRDSVWARAEKWCTVLAVQEEDVDADSGRIRTWAKLSVCRKSEGLGEKISGEWCDCGMIDDDTLAFSRYSVFYDIQISSVADNSSRVSVKCDFYASLDTVDTGDVWMGTFKGDPRWLPCNSKGKLEADMYRCLAGKEAVMCP